MVPPDAAASATMVSVEAVSGDVSEPFLDGTYPCIIKVTRKEDATVIPLAEVRNRITDYLLNSRISTETELIQNRLVFTETDAFQNTSIE